MCISPCFHPIAGALARPFQILNIPLEIASCALEEALPIPNHRANGCPCRGHSAEPRQRGVSRNHADTAGPCNTWSFHDVVAAWDGEVAPFADGDIDSDTISIANFIQDQPPADSVFVPDSLHSLDRKTSPRNRNTTNSLAMRFDMRCAANGIDHRRSKPNHTWTNRQMERMNHTTKSATVKRYQYDSHDQLHTHLADFVHAYNFARRLKTLSGLTRYDYTCKI